jgi:glycosyltransferase involved in cell wall biosynthesis
MKDKSANSPYDEVILHQQTFHNLHNTVYPRSMARRGWQSKLKNQLNKLPEVLVLSSYPPRECGIATYTQDLIRELNNKFSNSFTFKICAMESDGVNYNYPSEVKYKLNTSHTASYQKLSKSINRDSEIDIVLIQHEFGFFNHQEQAFLQFIYELTKPIAIVFHTVLPQPDEWLKLKIKNIASLCQSIVVMTNTSYEILINDYGIAKQKITIIAHGTHLIKRDLSKKSLKEKYGLSNRRVLSTFGLLSSGKNIETSLHALPTIIRQYPDVVFLIIGKTHPEVVKNEGEKYRENLEKIVNENGLQNNVVFINQYLSLSDLLEYLQMTDIYLFTSNDPNQAVSGTFVYAMSCGCPIISTPIPHAKEVLVDGIGILFEFQNSLQLAQSALQLLDDEELRLNTSTNVLQKITSTAWENTAIAHVNLFQSMSNRGTPISYNLPIIKLDHIKLMTTNVGIIQFSKINQPDINTGYTLDDNARALVAICMYFEQTKDEQCIPYIQTYLNFIKSCQQPQGEFLNYIDKDNQFTEQNQTVNLDDSNGRAIWALGYVISLSALLPNEIVLSTEVVLKRVLVNFGKVHSTRAMAFAIKGLYYSRNGNRFSNNTELVIILANRLVQMYKHESNPKWEWFEGYLTYANSILPESLLYAWLMTGDQQYKDVAKSSLNFLLSMTFNEKGIAVISNRSWMKKGEETSQFGEQPIDAAYTIMTLGLFYDVYMDENYRIKMETAFNWFLGNNRLNQIIYNPCTGGCYDGMEETHVNLNQGAESTISYLMARLTLERFKNG